MVNDYISIGEVLDVASKAASNPYKLIQGKKIMFESRLENGESIALCSPQSKFHPQGFYWCDMTSIQCELLDKYDNAIVIFRLQGRKMMIVNWGDLKPFFTIDCMRENKDEGTHWKMNIYDDHIKVSGNPIELKVQSFSCAGKTE